MLSIAELTAAQKSELARISLYGTKYELVICKGDKSYLLAYSAGRSGRDIVKVVQGKAPHVLRVTGLDENARFTFEKPVSLGAVLGDWEIKFSGRTQRECIIHGELPFIVEVK